jgi:dipeptidyl aminopeptidase/acylaminoacyl peptidase
VSTHPTAPVPESLFDDEREQRWRARFTAVRMSRPAWALDAPDRCVYTSNRSGTTQVHLWDRASDTHRQLTHRPAGTFLATLPPAGEEVWWFADTDGDEFGHWVTQSWAGGPQQVPLPDVEDGYPAGLDVGRERLVVGTSTDEGTTIWVAERGGPASPVGSAGYAGARVVYRHKEDAGVGGLSEDETLVAISHSEHGDSRHPALRVLTAAGETVAEKSDGPGKGLNPIAFSPVRGDQRLLVGHERRGREELLLWDVAADTETVLDLDLPGELDADFYPDASALLIWHTHAARTRLYRYDLGTAELTELPTVPGCIGSADVRPDGVLEYTASSAAHPSAVHALGTDGTDRILVSLGEPAPDSVPVEDVWVEGVHTLVARPEGEGPFPAVFALHGGPHAADEDRFSAMRATWVDAGFAVVEVNYRGSTGYGSVWRDAIEGRPGLTELRDVADTYDALVAEGVLDPARCVIEGWSWGGYLALLGAGTQPERWAAVIAGVPVADYVAAYEDEMEQLRAFDRALFGGSPQEVPQTYVQASPLTYVGEVRAPVLVLAGENDPRCPIRQIDNYLDALAERGDLPYEVARFDAGHGSLVVAETMRHVATEIDFARRALARVTLPTP